MGKHQYKVVSAGVLYATVDSLENMLTRPDASKWYTDDGDYLQVASMVYNAGKVFKIHKHKYVLKESRQTQECLIVLKGSAKVKIYANSKKRIETVKLVAGDFIILFTGYHGLEITEDNTVLLETKNGPFVGVENDKIFLK